MIIGQLITPLQRPSVRWEVLRGGETRCTVDVNRFGRFGARRSGLVLFTVAGRALVGGPGSRVRSTYGHTEMGSAHIGSHIVFRDKTTS